VGAMVMDGESARTVTGTVRLLRQADQVGEDIQVGHELLTDAQLAERWQLSRGTLANQRSQGRGPSYIKIAGRVRYRRSDIEAYEQAGLVSTQ
jgi:predicted DNA-binding transcriptional regulator AlpA